MKTKFLIGLSLIFALTACSATLKGVKVEDGGKIYQLEEGSFGVGKKEPSTLKPKP